MKRIVFITLYDTVCFGTRLLSSLVKECGFKSHLIFLKQTNYIPLFRKKDKKNPIQFIYNGLLRGGQYTVDPVTKTEMQLLLKTLERISPSVICLSTRSFAYDICKNIVPKIKERFPKVPIVGGGWGPTLAPEQFLAFCDYVCFGEGEKTIVNICECLQTKRNINSVPNLIYYNGDGRIQRNKVENPLTVEEIDKLPLYDYFSFENKHLISNNRICSGKETINVKIYDCYASRGCPFNCTYCLSSEFPKLYKTYSGKVCPKYRLRSIDAVMNEIQYAKDQGAIFIRIRDELFSIRPDWVDQFIQRYDKQIGLPFFAQLHPEFHDADTIKRLKDIGLLNTTIGIQSGSHKIRYSIYRRRLPADRIIAFAHLLQKLNIQYVYHFIYQNPFEREKHLDESLNFTYKLPYSSTFIFKLEPYLGTPIKKLIEREQPVPIPDNVSTWYAILHCMSLKNKILRTLSKHIRNRNLFITEPNILCILFIPSLIKEYLVLLKNKLLLNASTSYFSYKHIKSFKDDTGTQNSKFTSKIE